MEKAKKKRIIAGSTAAVVALGIFASTTMFSNAMTLDKAKNLAQQYVPKNAKFINEEEEKTKFELKFYDSTEAATYDVEVSKDEERVMEVLMDKDSDLGGASVKITEAQAKDIVTKEFTGANVSAVYLNVDDNKYTYDVDFRANEFYGDAELNAETGEILESKVKYGQAVTIPVDDNTNAKNTASSNSTGLITYEQAKSIAQNKNSGTIKSCSLDEDNGVFVYDVDFTDGSEVKINAKTGTIVSSKKPERNTAPVTTPSHNSGNSGSSNSAPANPGSGSNSGSNSNSSGRISEAQVRNIVLAKVPGATIHFIEFDYDDGIAVYEVDAYKGMFEYSFEINASSGVIIEFDKEHIYD